MPTIMPSRRAYRCPLAGETQSILVLPLTIRQRHRQVRTMSDASIRLEEAKRVLNAGGGIPVVREGRIIGAVGASAGSVVQDIAVAEAAIAAIA